ncbi:MAG: sigma 54-interacting transcriptional regulator [Candidatus Glassbacteria bacterium]
MKIPSQRENIESLFKIIRELVPERDIEKLLERVINVSTEILGSDRALLFLYDKKTDGLVFKYGVNVIEGLVEAAHEFSSSVIERAMKGEVIMTSDAQKDEKLMSRKSIREHDIKTILCAPIKSHERLIGVIYTDTRGMPTMLDDERKTYFLSFVDLIADVIGKEQDSHEKEEELSYLKRRLADEILFPEIIGRSSSVDMVKKQIMRIASVDYPVCVLITGESGSGKELIARAIHQAGARSGKPFVVVNCAAIPANLMESELFGHEKGAFTGAHTRKQGFFEVADGGVIFLDEIGELSVELQPKLLRILQFGTFTRVGGRTELSTNVQVVCATSRDLYQDMEGGRFKKALFHRLAVEIVHVPPMRERREDILLLANHFMKDFSEKMDKPLTGIDTNAQKILKGHDYSENNVRELKNIIERAVLKAEGKSITARDIVFSDELLLSTGAHKVIPDSGDAGDDRLIHLDDELVANVLEESRGKMKLERKERPYYRINAVMEKKLILLSLRQSGWKVKPAAKLLGIDHLSLRTKLGTLIRELMDETGGDIAKASRKYRIPPQFLKSKLYLTGIEENGNK